MTEPDRAQEIATEELHRCVLDLRRMTVAREQSKRFAMIRDDAKRQIAQSLEVVKQLRFGGKVWLRDLLKDWLITPPVTDKELDTLGRFLDGDFRD